MVRFIDHKKMGRSSQGWLESRFHFSFAEYYNPDNVRFGVIRVINDDIVQANTGFDTHPHKDMEIITYVLEGELTHSDSMDNKRVLTRGQVQYMSAGTGIRHSEYNLGKEKLRLLQIWILPDATGHHPNYGDRLFEMNERENKWLHIVGSANNQKSKAPIAIHQDLNLYATLLTDGKPVEFPVKANRQAYLVMAEGAAEINGIQVNERDAMEIIEEDILIKPDASAHILILEMAKP